MEKENINGDNQKNNAIEHLILSGGGHNILSIFGAIKFLKEKEYIVMDRIKSIDATSAGALLGFALLLGLEDANIETYFIKRPWEKIFNITPDLVFQSFKSKGLFDVKLVEKIFQPLMDAMDISLDITFAEFYEKNGVELTIYATELNKLVSESFSYKTTPSLRILDALYRSSAIPPLFRPDIIDDKCYLDGGVFSNYPLDDFLERNPDVERKKVFGVKLLGNPNNSTDSIHDDSTITDYLSCTIKKLIQQIIIHKDNRASIPNELLFHSAGFTYNTLKDSISSEEERIRLIGEGKKRASEYYHYKIKEF